VGSSFFELPTHLRAACGAASARRDRHSRWPRRRHSWGGWPFLDPGCPCRRIHRLAQYGDHLSVPDDSI